MERGGGSEKSAGLGGRQGRGAREKSEMTPGLLT